MIIAHPEFLRAARRLAPIGNDLVRLSIVSDKVQTKTMQQPFGSLLQQASRMYKAYYPATMTGTIKLFGGF